MRIAHGERPRDPAWVDHFGVNLSCAACGEFVDVAVGQIKPVGDRRFLSMFPFTWVTFWGYPMFDPQPCNVPCWYCLAWPSQVTGGLPVSSKGRAAT